MKISVIVPAFNEEKLISASLRSMKAAAAAFKDLDWETELIVCDNNSTDRTGELARMEGAIVVFEPVNQIARARNAGAAAATGDWFIFVDADSQPSRELFADVAQAIKSGKIAAGGSTLRLDRPLLVAGLFAEGWNWISRITKWAAGSFIFCDARLFREIGGFSHDLYVGEELELSKKLQKAAKVHGKKMVILNRHKLVTSSRKAKLYTPAEMFGFMFRALFLPSRTMKDRAACQPWYDGRR